MLAQRQDMQIVIALFMTSPRLEATGIVTVIERVEAVSNWLNRRLLIEARFV